MKNEIKPTYVDGAKFENLLSRLGFTQTTDKAQKAGSFLVQKGFVKVMGNTGRNIYIATTKAVSRIDISGFSMESGEGYLDLGEDDAFGAVHQQVEFRGRTEEQILQATEDAITHMLTLEPVVKVSKAKAPGAKAANEKAQGWSVVPPKKDRALIEKTAKEMGVEVSPNA